MTDCVFPPGHHEIRQRPKRQRSSPSALNMAIEAFNPVMEVSSTTRVVFAILEGVLQGSSDPPTTLCP